VLRGPDVPTDRALLAVAVLSTRAERGAGAPARRRRAARRARAGLFPAPLIGALVASVAVAAVGVGGRIAAVRLEDQHGKVGVVDAGTRVLVVSRDMDGGGLVKEAFADVDQAWLEVRRVVYVADISGMPALVSRLMAVPRMRGRAYRVLLDRDGAVARELPHEKGRATVLRLDDLVIRGVEHPATGPALRAAIEAAAAR